MFLVISEQDGEGCDYTIGCGIALHRIESADMSVALHNVAVHAVANEHNELRYKRVWVVPADAVQNADLESERRSWADKQAAVEAMEQRDREMAQLAALQAKYGKG